MRSSTYLIIVGIIFCIGLAGAFASGRPKSEFHRKGELITLALTLLFFVSFALTFESYNALSSIFALCLTLGVIWCERYRLGNFIAGLSVSAICTAGIWLVFVRIFSLSLP